MKTHAQCRIRRINTLYDWKYHNGDIHHYITKYCTSTRIPFDATLDLNIDTQTLLLVTLQVLIYKT